jgi:RNA polymerase sigma factor (sigma-70 family)
MSEQQEASDRTEKAVAQDTIPTVPITQLEGPQLLVALQAGNEEAWDTILRLYAKDLRVHIGQSLRKYSIPPEWVDDIEQDTWITAVKKIEEFEWQGEDKLYHWLRSIAFQHVRTLNRKLKETGPSFDAMKDNIDNELALDLFCYANGVFEESPETSVTLKDTLSAIEAAMHHLKPRAREILVRRLIWRETPAEMAADYGISPEKISGILFRAKETLRVQLTAINHLNRGGE